MNRREFICLLGGSAVTWSLIARAQQTHIQIVGVLVVGAPGSEKFWRLFQEALRERGYVEGKTIKFVFR
jgi:putative tryptophan/tyrosine transport system substrate-binding protein